MLLDTAGSMKCLYVPVYDVVQAEVTSKPVATAPVDSSTIIACHDSALQRDASSGENTTDSVRLLAAVRGGRA